MKPKGNALNSNEHDNDLEPGIRLQVWLARAGVASRRSAVELIQNGRVKINGKVSCEPGARVSDTDAVSLDNRPLGATQRRVYYVLHKPSKFLCSTADEDGQHRALALELIQPFVKERLFSVGRLDYMTSGLLLLTNDGDWARHLAHPSSSVEKEYLVQTKKEVPTELLEQFKSGIRILGEKFQCKDFSVTGPHSVRLVLAEGKNREIRKVFQSRNITVKRVHRLRVGPVTLRGLEAGRFRKLTEQEIQALRLSGGSDDGHRD
jgi:23S rRNA pseudouridine2605 synthase